MSEEMEQTLKGKPTDVFTQESLKRLGIETDTGEIVVTLHIETVKKRSMKEIVTSSRKYFEEQGGTKEILDGLLAENDSSSSKNEG